MTLFTETLPPADQPYAVPENWVWMTLKQINTRISKTVDPTKRLHETFELYSVPSFDEYIPEFLTGEDIKSSKQAVAEGDILLCKINPRINRVWIVGNFSAHQKIASSEWIVIRTSHVVYNHYLLWCLRGHDFRHLFTSQVAGVGGSLMRARPKDVIDYPIPIPPFPEQRRIASKLDALLGKLREARALIDEARESFALRRAAILHQAFSGMLTAQWRAEHPDITARSGGWFDEDIKETPYQIPETWKWISLGSVCRLKHGFAFKKDDYCEKGIPIIRISDIHDGRVSFKYAQNVPETLYDERFQVKKGDILIALSGATTGKNGVFYDDVFVMQNQRVGNLKISRPDILIEGYRNFFIQHSQTQILQLAYGGAQPNINADLIEGLPLPLPPFEEQREIVRQLDSLLGHEAAAAALLDMDDELDLLEQSILSRAFRGELGTNDPAEPPAI